MLATSRLVYLPCQKVAMRDAPARSTDLSWRPRPRCDSCGLPLSRKSTVLTSPCRPVPTAVISIARCSRQSVYWVPGRHCAADSKSRAAESSDSPLTSAITPKMRQSPPTMVNATLSLTPHRFKGLRSPPGHGGELRRLGVLRANHTRRRRMPGRSRPTFHRVPARLRHVAAPHRKAGATV